MSQKRSFTPEFKLARVKKVVNHGLTFIARIETFNLKKDRRVRHFRNVCCIMELCKVRVGWGIVMTTRYRRSSYTRVNGGGGLSSGE